MEKIRNVFSAIITLVLATAFLVAAFMTASDTADFLQASIAVPGQVVALPFGGSHPKIAFVAKTGETISYIQSGLVFNMKVGDDVQVRYLSENPRSTARLDQFLAIWTWTVGTGFMGSVFLLIGVSYVWKIRHGLAARNR